jgi:hypothetical protein
MHFLICRCIRAADIANALELEREATEEERARVQLIEEETAHDAKVRIAIPFFVACRPHRGLTCQGDGASVGGAGGASG